MGTIVPNMGTPERSDSTATALFGKARLAILGLLFSHADESFYLRQIVRIVGAGQGAVQRELGNLVRSGLVKRTSQGKQVYYQANRGSPVFADLRGLIIKTAGVADVLRGALAPLADRIDLAFVYGSIARGTEKSDSDIDVMVIGGVEFGEVVAALSQTQDQLNRETNPSVFSMAEIRSRIQEKDHFVTSVLREPRITLIGDDSELGTVA